MPVLRPERSVVRLAQRPEGPSRQPTPGASFRDLLVRKLAEHPLYTPGMEDVDALLRAGWVVVPTRDGTLEGSAFEWVHLSTNRRMPVSDEYDQALLAS